MLSDKMLVMLFQMKK